MLLCNLLHLSPRGYNRELTAKTHQQLCYRTDSMCRYGVQGHSRSLMLVPVEKARMQLPIVNNIN